MNSTKVSLVEAAFSYGERQIFSGLNIEVNTGDVFCILGPNGCGKTTLLHCLRGTLNLQSGKALLSNKNISSMGPVETAKLMSLVAQEQATVFSYPVIQTVLIGRAPHIGLFATPTRKDIKVAEEALEMVGIYHLRDRPYTQISGGERQLALIARALAQEPEVILLDEPTSHLDFKNQTLVLRMIKKLAEQGLTVIMSSHFPNHAFLFSSRVAMMNDGKFIVIGNPDEVMTEENLRATYGIDVKLFSVDDPATGDTIKFCIPAERPTDVIASSLAGIENVFEGQARLEEGIARIDIGGGTWVEAIARKEGKVKVYIPSGEIIISRYPIKSSGRNVLKGQIANISARSTTVKLEVDVGQRLAILITEKSFLGLELTVGMDTYVAFKASAVHVL